ncbi:MAG: hypothetical protein RLN99_15840 [Kiloniellaceae bacterium]
MALWEAAEEVDGVAGGTRFRLFPQSPALDGFSQPETVRVSPLPGSIGPGPFDGAMRVVDAIDKPGPYEFPYMPPYRGSVFPPAMPGPDGHFDRIPVDSRAFLSAHMYGAVRFVLDAWEGYLGHQVAWYDPSDGFVVELVPQVDWDNAHAGVGFIETGGRVNDAGRYQSFALNFDVIAHEVGHTMLFSEVGIPTGGSLSPQFLAFHESMSDLVALVSSLHFESVLDGLIDQTGGNLYVLNWLNRVGELSDSQQIRVASNDDTMADLASLTLSPDGEWIDPTGQNRKVHDLAQPLTGAIFDNLVEVYQDGLARRGLIPPELDPRGWDRAGVEGSLARFQQVHEGAVMQHRDAFIDALIEARDVIGRALAMTWQRLDPARVTFDGVAGAFMDAMAAIGQEHNLQAFSENFRERGIQIGAPTVTLAAPPPRTAPYAVRARWMRRTAAAASGTAALEMHAGTPDDYARVYSMFNHSFRLEV